MNALQGKRGIIVGVANADSIAWGCARACREAGAEILAAYGHPKSAPYVEPLFESWDGPKPMYVDVRDPATVAALFETAKANWGQVDFLVHSVAFARMPDLHQPLVESSNEAFAEAIDISCHSFTRLARAAAEYMPNGGSMFTMSFLGAVRAVDNYNLMGPVKAALESSARYLAAELGPRGIRVNAISPGPIATRAASGLKEFNDLLSKAEKNSPMRRLATIDDVGGVVAMLASDAGAMVTGQTIYVDGGYHVAG